MKFFKHCLCIASLLILAALLAFCGYAIHHDTRL
jgi:hypothetical protein